MLTGSWYVNTSHRGEFECCLFIPLTACLARLYLHIKPEVMTSHDLHIVMTALDEGSFRVVEPLHLPPSPEKPVFESAPSPVVVMGDESEVPDMYDSDGEEKKSDDVVDLTIGESTRDESRISAFSVNGFLKLLESRGNDISNWPEIEPAIASVLKLKLMLHQQHAICWMLQMESLGGYGINRYAFITLGWYSTDRNAVLTFALVVFPHIKHNLGREDVSRRGSVLLFASAGPNAACTTSCDERRNLG